MTKRFPELSFGCKFLLVFLFVLAFNHNASAQCTGSSPTWKTTIDEGSVMKCISNAVNGDTVNVSSGSATWSSVTIPSTKGLALACPSMSCNVTLSAIPSITINTNSTKSSTVTGFTFSGSNGCCEGNLQVNYSAGNAPFRIYNNSFTGNGTQVGTNGTGSGLIDHNTINSQGNADESFHIKGVDTYTEDVVPGSANMLFIENNAWNAATGYCQAEESFAGAIYVFRYNHLNGCQNDAHASDGSGGPGMRWAELYNNNYNNCCTSGSFYDWRGGSGVLWGNTVTNNPANSNLSYGPVGSDLFGTYPVTYQFGTGIGSQIYSPAYTWGNASAIQNSPSNKDTSMVQIGTAPNDPAHCSGLSGNLCNAIVT